MKVAYCTGFWCTNIGNGFFSLGVQHALCRVFGQENVTVVSDYQTYTDAVGKRLYPHKHQLEYISSLDVDLVVLAGPVLSRYFLRLWKEILLKLQARGVGYMLLSAGTMKLNEEEAAEIRDFFRQCPPRLFMSRETATYERFADVCPNACDGICFSFFAPEVNPAAGVLQQAPYIVMNFDKTDEPKVWIGEDPKGRADHTFTLTNGQTAHLRYPVLGRCIGLKTDRFTDALAYVMSLLPPPRRGDRLGDYRIVRTDHRFHPHYRSKIYRFDNSFVSDIPQPYLTLYANAALTLSDRVHACAATLAYGGSAMLFARTNRVGLLERVGAEDVCSRPVRLDMERLAREKESIIACLGRQTETM